MTNENEVLSKVVTYMKYAKYIPGKQRRETWEELVQRNIDMHVKKYPHLEKEINSVYKDFVLTKKVLPSMRSLQFAGKAIEVNNARIFNCAYLPADSIHAFSETMFLLLSGTGVGYSIQKEDVSQLPAIKKPSNRQRKYVIQDSIMGWADAVKTLMKSYMGKTTSTVVFDFSEIREKGALLVTAGGKAPGPGPLRVALVKIENILASKQDGEQLTPLEVHDILCHIADSVLAGGIRRSAMISLFDANEVDMLHAKAGQWWDKDSQRGRANNSVVLDRAEVTFDQFKDLWQASRDSRAGEPGFYFTNDKKKGTNPCVEISLNPNQFCNLVEVNGAAITCQADLDAAVGAAAFLGTLQAGYTDFHYLREVWKEQTEKEALLGVSITGLANRELLDLDFEEAAKTAIIINYQIAGAIGINTAARLTCVKPAGTTSLVLGTSSGIHAYHDKYYIRRISIGKNESLYTYLSINHPELLEDKIGDPRNAFISVPQKAPEGAILRSESSIDLLERVKKISQEWIATGHISGENMHNVSCTVSVKEEEWDIVRDWMWTNKELYNGISIMPYDTGTYVQTPFETIDEATYEKLHKHIHDVDLSKVIEIEDNTDLQSEAACSGGACEIT